MRWPSLARFGGALHVAVDAGVPTLVSIGCAPVASQRAGWDERKDSDGRTVWVRRGALNPTFKELRTWFPELEPSDVREHDPREVLLASERFRALNASKPDPFDGIAARLQGEYGLDMEDFELVLRDTLTREPDVADPLRVIVGRLHLTALASFQWTPPAPEKKRGKVVDRSADVLEALREQAERDWRETAIEGNRSMATRARRAIDVRDWLAEQSWQDHRAVSDLLDDLEERLQDPWRREAYAELDAEAFEELRERFHAAGATEGAHFVSEEHVINPGRGWSLVVQQGGINQRTASRFSLSVRLDSLVYPRYPERDGEVVPEGRRRLVEVDAPFLEQDFGLVGSGVVTGPDGELYVYQGGLWPGRGNLFQDTEYTAHLSHANRLVPAVDWPHETETYSERLKRWDGADTDRYGGAATAEDERSARGNCVGVTLTYRGKSYVMAEPVLFRPPHGLLFSVPRLGDDAPVWDFKSSYPTPLAAPSDLFATADDVRREHEHLVDHLAPLLADSTSRRSEKARAARAELEAGVARYEERFGARAWQFFSFRVGEKAEQLRQLARETDFRTDAETDEDDGDAELDDSDDALGDEEGTELESRDGHFDDASDEISALVATDSTASASTSVEMAEAVAERLHAPDTRIDDAGEKIGGARKDRATRRRYLSLDEFKDLPIEARRGIAKQAVWPAPDWLALSDAGASNMAVFHFFHFYKAIPAQPGSMDCAEQYVEALEELRRVFENGIAAFDGTARDVARALGTIGVESGFIEREERQYGVTTRTTPLAAALGQERFRLVADKLFLETSALFPKRLRYWEDRRQRAAEQWVSDLRSAAVARKARGQTPRIRAKNHSIEAAVQAGAPVIRDSDMTPEALMETFGLRAVEFGNWVPQEERQALVNMTADSFHTLALLLDVPPVSLGLGGKLAVSYGARGHGRGTGNAHYEPAKVVLHLTRFKGVGAIAHEMAHALDDHLGRQRVARFGQGPSVNWRDDYLSHQLTRRVTIRKSRGQKTFGVTMNQCDETESAFGTAVQKSFYRGYTANEEANQALRNTKHGLSMAVWSALSRVAGHVPSEERQFIEQRLSAAVELPMTEALLEELQGLDGLPWPAEIVEHLRVSLGRSIGERVDAAFPDGFNAAGWGWRHAERSGMPAGWQDLGLDGLQWKDAVLPALLARQRAQWDAACLALAPSSVRFAHGSQSLVTTEYQRAAAQLDRDRSGSPYWATTHEMFARAFEAWTIDTLDAHGWRDDCLVRPEASSETGDSVIFPRDDDREVLRQAFDEFAIVLKARLVDTARTQDVCGPQPKG